MSDAITEAAPPEGAKPPPRRHRRRIVILSLIAVVVVCTIIFLRSSPNKNAAGKAGSVQAAVPVETSTAKKGDIGVYLSALGTVTPVYTVSVLSRVQGQIMSVNYREGQMVHKGDSLIEIDPRPYEAALTQAQGQLLHDEGELREARIDLKRYKKAYARNAIPKQQLDDQEQVVLQDQGTVLADQGALENAKVNLIYCHITSPIDGRVGLRLIDAGNIVQANSTTPLVVVAQLQPITVIFSVAEDFIPKIQAQLHQQSAMEVDAFDRSEEKKIATGTFLTLDNVVDTTTGTVKLRAVFPNEDSALFPNQFVNARLLVDTQKGATLVSSPAIQRNAQGAFVYVIKSDETAEMREVKVGTTEGGVAAIQGVNPGETVAVNGFDKLQEGAKVVIRQANHEAAGQAAP